MTSLCTCACVKGRKEKRAENIKSEGILFLLLELVSALLNG